MDSIRWLNTITFSGLNVYLLLMKKYMENIVLPRYEVTLTENKMQELKGIIPKRGKDMTISFIGLQSQNRVSLEEWIEARKRGF